MSKHASYKRRVRASFDRTARDYAQYTGLQHALAGRLAALASRNETPGRILDVGAGSGYVGAAFAKRFPNSRVVRLDIACESLRSRPDGEAVCGDMERLPFASGAFDMVVSGAALHWCTDWRATLGEVRRVMRPGARALLATMGDGTLAGLAQCWRGVDAWAHVMPFPSSATLRDLVAESGLALERLLRQREVVVYDSPAALFAALKHSGASYRARNAAERGLTTRARLAQAARRYASRCAWRGKVYAEYELVFCCVRANATDAPQTRSGTSVPATPS